MPQYNFTPTNGVPDFYGPLMNAAAGNLVRMPDGTFTQAPRYMPPATLQQIYGGMINAQGAPGQQAQAIRAVTVNPDGTPADGSGGSLYDAAYQPGVPTSSAYRGGWGSDAFGGISAGGQAGGQPSIPMPPTLMADNGGLSASGTMVAGKDQSRLGTSPQGMAFAYGQGIPNVPTPPGLSAIARALGTGAAFNPGTWGSAGLFGGGNFLSGDPGQTDWSVANQGGQGINGPVSAPSSLPPNPSPNPPGNVWAVNPDGTSYRTGQTWTPPVPRTPAFHAALMALQQLTTPASQSAVAAGQGGYVVKGGNSGPSKRGRNGNALGENAMMPTRAMDGTLRNTYGD